MKSIIALIVLATLIAGCSHASKPAPGSTDVLARLPSRVQAAFRSDHPRAAVKRAHIRLFPDGTMHYQIAYVDSDGQLEEAEYLSDGQPVP